MVHHTTEQYAELSTEDGLTPPALQSASVSGQLDGLLLRMVCRQTYRNQGDIDLETVYTFPLPYGAVLLALNVEIGGQRLQGTVLPKQEATERYEDAITEGDTPVMVTASAQGLYTANLGNLRPGDEAVIEITYAQALTFEQGRLRLAVPTVVAPRYGDAHGPGGLAVHESTSADAQVEYPFTLSLTLNGPVANGQISSPSHRIETQHQAEQTTITLARDAWLDRDFVLSIDGLHGQSFCLQGADGEHTMAMASFCPTWEAKTNRPLLLKLLVDCSGSMAGDSIGQARAALRAVSQELVPQDHVSYTRFGSQTVQVIPRLEPCAPNLQQHALQRAILFTEADLGGTEMAKALRDTLAIPRPRGQDGMADVLIITDGEVWQVDDIIRLAQHSGHRIFAVGVGSAPAESLLRSLAERTGGACEFVTPNEDMASAVLRMFHRMRQGQAVNLQVNWGQTPIWQSPLPRLLVPGETVHAYALLPQALDNPPALHWQSHQAAATETDQVQHLQVDPTGTVTRLGGANRLHHVQDAEQAKALALHYQLVSEHTHLILVHQRAEGDKAVGLPQLQQIAQMQTAGWGGLGSVRMRESRMMLSMERTGSDNVAFMADVSKSRMRFGKNASHSTVAASVWRTRDRAPVELSNYMSTSGMDDFEFPAFLRKQAEDTLPEPDELTPTTLMLLANQHLQPTQSLEPLIEQLERRFKGHPTITQLVDALENLTGDRMAVWAMLLLWLHEQFAQHPAQPPHGHLELHRFALRHVRHGLRNLNETTQNRINTLFQNALPNWSPDHWGALNLQATP